MRLNRKLMGGLAWLGAIALFAVPSAELVSSQLDPTPTLALTSDTRHVEVASVAADPVDDFLAAGKPLPSYISGTPKPVAAPAPVPASGPSVVPAVAATPAPIKTVPLTAPEPGTETWAPVQTASTHQPAGVAPMPMPVTMRPVAPAAYEPVLILDEAEVLAREAALNRPPADLPVPVLEPRVVESDELEEWDSGSLADYLARRGLLDEGTTSSRAVVTQNEDVYDPDGFFLDEGPSTNRRRLPPGEIDEDGDYFIVFPEDR